jgi:hypothetical membrane protein
MTSVRGIAGNPWRENLLACGVLAAILYVGATFAIGLLWNGYSVTTQTISELSAIGAPTRSLWSGLMAIYTALMIAFASGLWRFAPNRPLRIAGALLLTQVVFAVFWPPMHQRDVLAAGGRTLTDTLHVAWMMVSGILFMASMAFAAAAFGRRFRLWTAAMLVVLFTCGMVTGTYNARLEANLPTPGLGLWERVSAAAFMVWVASLAVALLRGPDAAPPGLEVAAS